MNREKTALDLIFHINFANKFKLNLNQVHAKIRDHLIREALESAFFRRK